VGSRGKNKAQGSCSVSNVLVSVIRQYTELGFPPRRGWTYYDNCLLVGHFLERSFSSQTMNIRPNDLSGTRHFPPLSLVLCICSSFQDNSGFGTLFFFIVMLGIELKDSFSMCSTTMLHLPPTFCRYGLSWVLEHKFFLGI
jgi:hypothetical protein